MECERQYIFAKILSRAMKSMNEGSCDKFLETPQHHCERYQESFKLQIKQNTIRSPLECPES